MYAVGIDIGTTTVCGVLLDAATGKVEAVKTLILILFNDSAFRERLMRICRTRRESGSW